MNNIEENQYIKEFIEDFNKDKDEVISICSTITPEDFIKIYYGLSEAGCGYDNCSFEDRSKSLKVFARMMMINFKINYEEENK